VVTGDRTEAQARQVLAAGRIIGIPDLSPPDPRIRVDFQVVKVNGTRRMSGAGPRQG
jgi:hypothetical protein